MLVWAASQSDVLWIRDPPPSAGTYLFISSHHDGSLCLVFCVSFVTVIDSRPRQTHAQTASCCQLRAKIRETFCKIWYFLYSGYDDFKHTCFLQEVDVCVLCRLMPVWGGPACLSECRKMFEGLFPTLPAARLPGVFLWIKKTRFSIYICSAVERFEAINKMWNDYKLWWLSLSLSLRPRFFPVCLSLDIFFNPLRWSV